MRNLIINITHLEVPNMTKTWILSIIIVPFSSKIYTDTALNSKTIPLSGLSSSAWPKLWLSLVVCDERLNRRNPADNAKICNTQVEHDTVYIQYSAEGTVYRVLNLFDCDVVHNGRGRETRSRYSRHYNWTQLQKFTQFITKSQLRKDKKENNSNGLQNHYTPPLC